MNSKVRLVDKINNQVIYYGIAKIESMDTKDIIHFKDGDHRYIWKVFDTGLVIESISEVAVYLTLRKDHITKGHIDSQFGKLDLQCYTSLYRMDKNRIEVAYQLIQGNDKQEFRFELTIYKEDLYAVH